MKEILRVEHVQKYYGRKNNITKAVDDISFQVEEGEFLAIMGASGSGKTTLLNMIGTIDTVSAGHIYIEEEDITEISPKQVAKFRRERLGFIFQDYNLLDTFTLEENIAYALTINQVPAEQIPSKVLEIANELGIESQLKKYPYEVSGGQKQRCACARALVSKPSLILADEPTGALDSKSAQLLMELLSHVNDVRQATILMVTHDAFCASFVKRILFIQDGRVFMELVKGEKTRKQFFHEILDVLTMLGGDLRDVR